jgi:hypothetical protein
MVFTTFKYLSSVVIPIQIFVKYLGSTSVRVLHYLGSIVGSTVFWSLHYLGFFLRQEAKKANANE